MNVNNNIRRYNRAAQRKVILWNQLFHYLFLFSCVKFCTRTHNECTKSTIGLRQIFLGHHDKITEHGSPRSSNERQSVCFLQTDSEMSQKGNWVDFLNQIGFQKMLTIPHYLQKITSFRQIVKFSPEIALLVSFQQTRRLSDVLTDKTKMLFRIVNEEDSKGC